MDLVYDVQLPIQGKEHQIDNRRLELSVMREMSRCSLREHAHFKTKGESLQNKLTGNPTLPRMIGIPISGVAVKVPTHVQQSWQLLNIVPDPADCSSCSRVVVNVEEMQLSIPKEGKERHISMIDDVCTEGGAKMRQPPIDISNDSGSASLKRPIDTRAGTTEKNDPVRMCGRTHNRLPFFIRSRDSLTNKPPGRFLDEENVEVLTEQLQLIGKQVIFSVNVMTYDT
jgi:hypothetical protein